MDSKVSRLLLIWLGASTVVIWGALCFGGSFISPFALFSDANSMLVSELRLPRLLTDFMVGGGLSIVGLCFQTYFRNPLAEPYILGISGGAAFGVVIFFALLPSMTFLKPILAFAFAYFTVWFVYRFSGKFYRVNVGALILIGVGFNFLYASLITLAHSVLSAKFSKNVLLWSFGDTSSVTLPISIAALAIVTLLSIWLYLDSGRLNIYQLGDALAVNSGVNVQAMSRRIYLIGSLITAISVSLCGAIGFVGIVVPHLIRSFSGTDHRYTMIATYFAGGIFVVVIDTFFKTVFFPLEVPIGAVTAMVGAPFFIWILKKAVSK